MNLNNASLVVCVIASDLNTVKSFYAEKLGLRQITDQPEEMGLWFEAGGGTRLYVYQSTLPKPQNTVAYFKVNDVLATINELKAKGVQFESYDMDPIKTDENNIARFGNIQAAWFKDPEGNIFSVSN